MRLVIEDDVVTVTTPEKQELSMPLADWLAAVDRPQFDEGACPLPPGVVAFKPLRDGVILVHEREPSVRRLRWLADDSPAPYGSEAVYREVSLAMPYVLVLAVFRRGGDGLYRLTSDSEAFFRTAPVDSLEAPLQFPALLNCSSVEDEPSKPRSWLCVQHLRAGRAMAGADDAARLRLGLAELMRHFWEAGFNQSSERHEGSSWYAETVKAQVDPRLTSLGAWERATAEDPNFVLDVPWLDAGHTLGEMLDRVARRLGLLELAPVSVTDLARPVLRHHRKESPLERRRRELLESMHATGGDEVPF
jgi:hypothetical protein